MKKRALLRSRLLQAYKRSAKIRGFSWMISDEDFISIVTRPCFYCGSRPKSRRLHHNYELYETKEKWTGIDRVDSSVGYLLSNLVSCCSTCNGMKSNLSVGKFLRAIRRIYRYGSSPARRRAMRALMRMKP